MIINTSSHNGLCKIDIKHRANRVIQAQLLNGYCKRNIIKLIEGMEPIKSIPFIERIEPYTSIHYSTCLCMALESSNNSKIERNVVILRTMLLELERIYCHINSIQSILKYCKQPVLINICEAINKSIIDIFEELTGRRMYLTSNLFFDLSFKFSVGNVKFMNIACEKLTMLISKLEEYCHDNSSLISLLKGRSIIPSELTNKISGPFSWLENNNDKRVKSPYLAYSAEKIQIILKEKYQNPTNCIYSRLLVLVKDCDSSLKIINYLLDTKDLTHYSEKTSIFDVSFQEGSYNSSIETPRGLLEINLNISAQETLSKINISSPSSKNKELIGPALRGVEPENIVLAFNSLAISAMELDQ